MNRQKFSGVEQKNVLGPIEYLFKFLEQKVKVEIWLSNNSEKKFQGIIKGFDEWMNLVLDQAVEINAKSGQKTLGRILLKGDTICLVHVVDQDALK